MRQLRINERGSAMIWALVIVIILLLAFVYLWYDGLDTCEQAQADAFKYEKDYQAARNAALAFLGYGEDLANKVGFLDQKARGLIGDTPPPAAGPRPEDPTTEQLNVWLAAVQAEKDFKVGTDLAAGVVLTDLAQLDVHLAPDQFVGGDQSKPGLITFLQQAAQVEMVRGIRAQAADAAPETPAQFEWMTSEFKQKLVQISQMPIPAKPTPPEDPDDAAAVAEYQDELATFEEAVARYQAALDELRDLDGYKKFDKIIKPPRAFKPDETAVVTVDFFTQAVSGPVTIEKLFRMPKEIIPAIIREFKRNKEADASIIADLRNTSDTKQSSIDGLETQLAEEQQRHTSDVEGLQGELASANEQAESNRMQASEAMTEKLQTEENMKREIAKRDSQIAALENRVRIDKEERDLKVRRDDIDGAVLSGSPTMGTAIIDLGSRDKVYPGLKFNVSYMGRGSIRLPKGQIMVTRVLGKDTAKATILNELDPRNPIGQGDLIHNPLFSVTEEIHVYLAAELEKYPLDIALARLAKMRVIVDEEINGKTDYVVVPNSMAAPAPAAGEDDEEMEDEENGAAVGKSEFERIQSLARAFGATVITERMLNAFLDY